jgi:protein SCO1
LKLSNTPRTSALVFGRTSLFSLIFVSMIAMAITACGEDSHEFSGAVSYPPPDVQDFVLINQHGNDFQMSTDAKEVSIVFFGYTVCPDVCPTTLADMIKAKRKLGADAGRVSFIWVTVDPERDTPSVLGQRIEVFDPEFIGLSGRRESLEKVWEDFGIVVERDDSQGSAAGYLVSHTANTYLVDRDMKNRVVFPFGTASELIAADIAAILKEQKEN